MATVRALCSRATLLVSCVLSSSTHTILICVIVAFRFPAPCFFVACSEAQCDGEIAFCRGTSACSAANCTLYYSILYYALYIRYVVLYYSCTVLLFTTHHSHRSPLRLFLTSIKLLASLCNRQVEPERSLVTYVYRYFTFHGLRFSYTHLLKVGIAPTR